MKVVLINPPADTAQVREGRCTQTKSFWGTAWSPISLAYCAGVLHNMGHETLIIDSAVENVSEKSLENDFQNAKLAFVTIGNPTGQNDCAFAQWLKKKYPEMNVFLIGTYAMALAGDILKKHKNIDGIIMGEPEYTVRDIANAINNNNSLENINGLVIKNTDGKINYNSGRKFITNLDELPFPRWENIDTKKYRIPLVRKKLLLVAPMRGCPYGCSFCTTQLYYGKCVRKRSVESVVAEIERNVRDFNVRNFLMWAETFTIDKNFVLALCEAIQKSGLKIQWSANSRVDTVDFEMLKAMRQSGCKMISFGIESFSQKVLDACGKRSKVEQIEPAIIMARKAGLWTIGHFIIGLPSETVESAKKTIENAKKLPLDFAQFYAAAPFAGSRLWEETNKQSKESSQGNFAGNLNPQILTILKNAKYNFYSSPQRFIGWLNHIL